MSINILEKNSRKKNFDNFF